MTPRLLQVGGAIAILLFPFNMLKSFANRLKIVRRFTTLRALRNSNCQDPCRSKNYDCPHQTETVRRKKEFLHPILEPPHHPNPNPWKYALFLVAIPACIIQFCVVFVWFPEHPRRPEYKKYEYMYIHKKDYFWGDGKHTLFHNPRLNAGPDGYETEEEDYDD